MWDKVLLESTAGTTGRDQSRGWKESWRAWERNPENQTWGQRGVFRSSFSGLVGEGTSLLGCRRYVEGKMGGTDVGSKGGGIPQLGESAGTPGGGTREMDR